MYSLDKARFRKNLAWGIALIWVAFQLYIAFRAGIPTIVQRTVHVAFACTVVFLANSLQKDDKLPWFALDMACAAACLSTVFYIMVNGERFLSRIAYISPIYVSDVVVGATVIVLLIECCRRCLGMAMTLVVTFFIAYAFAGPSLPGIFQHRGTDFVSFIELQFMTTNGVYGTPTGVSVDTIFYFMIFGAFLAATPAGKLFISMAQFLTRKAKGGEGKATILACALFGMISGSAAANVATVGMLTYPSMEKAKFRPIFAASILSVAGTSGQLIPPIMGAAAFLMADFLGINYFTIVMCAIIPSALYILALYFLVHYESKKYDIQTPEVDIANLKRQIKEFLYLMIPLIMLVVLIGMGRSLMYSTMTSVALLLVLCAFKKESRMGIRKILDTMVSGALSSVVVAVPCAVAGIITGILIYTGFGLKVSALIAQVSQGSLFLALALTMVMVIILGMGLPTSAAYIMSAVLLAPAIQSLGVDPLVAHFFIFYFANLSTITPPVALASYAAAGIAKTPFWETGIYAFRLSVVIFTIPFVFVYSPALLGLGSAFEIITGFTFMAFGLLGMAIAIIGFARYPVMMPIRIVLGIASLMLIYPETISSIIGVVVVIVCWLYLNRERADLAVAHE